MLLGAHIIRDYIVLENCIAFNPALKKPSGHCRYPQCLHFDSLVARYPPWLHVIKGHLLMGKAERQDSKPAHGSRKFPSSLLRSSQWLLHKLPLGVGMRGCWNSIRHHRKHNPPVISDCLSRGSPNWPFNTNRGKNNPPNMGLAYGKPPLPW